MKKTVSILRSAAALASLFSLLALSACGEMPAQSQGIADTRPQISFKASTERVLGAKVIVDGRDMGRVGSFLEGDATLRVAPGTHMLIVASNNQLIYQQTFYAGSGGGRIFTVN